MECGAALWLFGGMDTILNNRLSLTRSLMKLDAAASSRTFTY